MTAQVFDTTPRFAKLFPERHEDIEINLADEGEPPNMVKLKDIQVVEIPNFFFIESQEEFQYSEPMNPERW